MKDEDGIEILEVDWEEPGPKDRKREGPRREVQGPRSYVQGPTYNAPLDAKAPRPREAEPPPPTPPGYAPPGYEQRYTDPYGRQYPPGQYQGYPQYGQQYPGYPPGQTPGYPVYRSYPGYGQPPYGYGYQPYPQQYPPRRLSDPMNRLNPLMVLLIFVFITVITTIIVLPILLVILFAGDPADALSILGNPVTMLILLVVQDIVFVIVPYLVYFKNRLLTWAEMGLNTDKLAERIMTGLAIGFGFSALVIGIVVGIDHTTSGGIPKQPQMSVADYVFTLIGGVIVAPIAEEFFFRGVAFKGVMKFLDYRQFRSPYLIALLFSSFIFAVVHGYDIFGTVVVFIAGMIFAMLYHKTGSLIPAMFAHGAYNAGVITASFFGLM